MKLTKTPFALGVFWLTLLPVGCGGGPTTIEDKDSGADSDSDTDTDVTVM